MRCRGFWWQNNERTLRDLTDLGYTAYDNDIWVYLLNLNLEGLDVGLLVSRYQTGIPDGGAMNSISTQRGPDPQGWLNHGRNTVNLIVRHHKYSKSIAPVEPGSQRSQGAIELSHKKTERPE